MVMSKNNIKIDLSKMSYTQRQLIVVQEDKVVEELRAAQNKEASAGRFDWQSIAMAAGKSFLNFGFGGVGVLVVKEAYEAWVRARESGLNILTISNSEAITLDLPPGHPRLGTLYVAHPTESLIYYTSASFHRFVFEHKFAEAVGLLMSLGASHIEVAHVCGWSREYSGNLGASIPAGSAEFSASAKAAQDSSILFKADYVNKTTPQLPKDLVWYPHEPTWQSVANGRLKYGMRNFSLDINYQDDFGVNAGLKVKAEKAGLDIGGSFENHKVTTWKITGEFGDFPGG